MTKVNEASLRAKYTLGCPGVEYQDCCAHPSECAEAGCCKIILRQQEAYEQIKSAIISYRD